MKLSRFNHFFCGSTVTISSPTTPRTTALARLEASEYAQIPALCDGREADTREQASALREAMAGAGFLVPDDADELDEFGRGARSSQGAGEGRGLDHRADAGLQLSMRLLLQLRPAQPYVTAGARCSCWLHRKTPARLTRPERFSVSAASPPSAWA